MDDAGGTIRISIGRRWLRWWVWFLLGVVVMLVGVGGFIWVEYAGSVELGETSPADGALLSTPAVTVSSALPGYEPGRGAVTLLVDGEAVPAARLTHTKGRVEAVLTLADGLHHARLEYTSSNVFSRRLVRAWCFSIDTTAPTMRVLTPVPGALLEKTVTRLEAAVNEPASVDLRVDDKPDVLRLGESGTGLFAAALSLDQGEHTFTLIATDVVGNTSTVSWQSYADYEAPLITVPAWPQDGVPWRDTSASVTFAVDDALPDNVTVAAALDGRAVTLTAGPATHVDRRAYSLGTGELAEGEHRLVLTARDRGGHETVWERVFLVDSSSVFGERPMMMGAVGKDVTQLQSALARRGLYEGKATGLFDRATADAVAAYNGAHGLPLDQVAGLETLAALIGSIRIDLSERTLYHYSDGSLRKTYSVAVGMPAYPTPTGSFEIISKVVDPTWTPPDSDWAEGMEPVGPGPDNPLGTRWMGIDSPGVGIHGTYTRSSIGTAASHGCIRMYLEQAEELFNLVYIGTPVEIVP